MDHDKNRQHASLGKIDLVLSDQSSPIYKDGITTVASWCRESILNLDVEVTNTF